MFTIFFKCFPIFGKGKPHSIDKLTEIQTKFKKENDPCSMDSNLHWNLKQNKQSNFCMHSPYLTLEKCREDDSEVSLLFHGI